MVHAIQQQSDRKQGENFSSIDILQFPHYSQWAIHKNSLLHFGTFKATHTTDLKKKHATVTPEGYTKI